MLRTYPFYRVPTRQHGNFIRKSSQPTGSLRDENRREQRQFPPILDVPSLNSYILHSVNLYQDFVHFFAKRVFYIYANKSLMQPVAVFFPSLFVTLSSYCEYPFRFAIKGATSFSCQGKCPYLVKCYTFALIKHNIVVFSLSGKTRCAFDCDT